MARSAPLTIRRVLGSFFVVFALSVIICIYSAVMRVFWPMRAGNA